MTIIAADINRNGSNEILAADHEGTLVCLDGNDKKIWESIQKIRKEIAEILTQIKKI